MPPAGGDTQRLTTDPGWDVSPIWSPTSMSIAFLTQEQGDWDLAVVNASGGAPRRLTSTPGFEGCHAWSPDGQSIAYCYVLVQQDLVRVDVSGLLGLQE